MLALPKRLFGHLLAYAPDRAKTYAKEANELLLWRLHLWKAGGKFYNEHFERFYTELFGLTKEDYAGKKVLDIGCGPLGTLEWANGAQERVGLDPLADKYLALNRGRQQMSYVKGTSEAIPFPDAHFDIVAIFNALDHVENVERTISEIGRVCAPNGDLLIIVEVDHPPTITEPHALGENVLEKFTDFAVVRQRICAIDPHHNVYASIDADRDRSGSDAPGILWAHLKKTTGPSAT